VIWLPSLSPDAICHMMPHISPCHMNSSTSIALDFFIYKMHFC
jgi:hypothetical protein